MNGGEDTRTLPVEEHRLGGERLAGEVSAPLGRVVARVVVAEDAIRAVVELLDLRLQDSIALRGELHGRLRAGDARLKVRFRLDN